jgi:S-adenosylmethionine hydrolase
MAGPLISLTTDFGLSDPSVAACKGVIWRIAPDARLLDVSHGVARHQIREGAALLWAALPSLPVGVHMAVVDPGVGTGRRPIALTTGRGDRLVGPDNGLLIPGAERLGGIVAAHLLEAPQYRLPAVSRTFHGRDVFAPAAAHLAAGVPESAFGPEIDPTTLVRLEADEPRVSPGKLEVAVAAVDSFGNAQLCAGFEELEAALGPVLAGDALVVQGSGGAIALRWLATYGDAGAGDALACLDSYDRLSIAVNMGDAARRFGLRPGEMVRIRRGG